MSPLILSWGFLAAAGILRTAAGDPIGNAPVLLKTASGAVVFETTTSRDGTFPIPELPPGTYELSAPGLHRESLVLPFSGDRLIEVQAQQTSITVTASRGAIVETEAAETTAGVVSLRVPSTHPPRLLGNLLEGQPNILVQQTSPAQVSPFLRGLTGYHVLNLLDGVRLNNSTFRSGPNQYLAFIGTNHASRIETVLGPASTEYGSDALGGLIHVFTREPGSLGWHGDGEIGFASADLAAAMASQISYASARTGVLFGFGVRRHQDLRAGGGSDSRHTLRRFFDLDPSAIRAVTGTRQQDTGFAQAGLHVRLAHRLTPSQILSGWFQHDRLPGSRNYKDLWGGLGRLQSDLTPQGLDFGYLRYEKIGGRWLDSLASTFSINSQHDGSVRRNLLATSVLVTDDTRTDAFGYTAQLRRARSRWLNVAGGGEIYDEVIHARRAEADPAVGTSRFVRPLYPGGSRYRTSAVFARNTAELVPGRLRWSGGLRWTQVRYRTQADEFGTVASLRKFSDTTWQTSLLWNLAGGFGLHLAVGRGFRAPNANDLGAVGLNDLGFEIPAADAIAARALLSSSAGETATSLGREVANLRPESLRNYEGGVRLHTGRFTLLAQYFLNDLLDPIVRRTLLFRAAGTPASLGGLPVRPIPATLDQVRQGVVTVAAPSDPRAVKAFVNDGQSRYHGTELQAHGAIGSRWQWAANYSYILGRDLYPNRHARRLPPQQGLVKLRHHRSHWWAEVFVLAQGSQTRLSGGDLDDERIGASRSRNDIASFFQGTRVSPWIRDGRFTLTGETLLQIQDRLLPGVPGPTRVPLYLNSAGWMTVNFAAGYSLSERWTLAGGTYNILDRNYRVHGSGADSPGVSAFVALGFRF
jgi:outer membrane receptor protein involved in Fe transport